MAEQETSYDAIVRTEIAIEIINQAGAIVTARDYELEGSDTNAAEALRAIAKIHQGLARTHTTAK